jgi:hypothetical protein
MKLLRSLHLYLGCIFAPMLIFMSVSGIWQTFGLQHGRKGKLDTALAYLSTIHTSWGLKGGGGLTSPAMKYFVVITAVSFLVTIVLGIVMAFRYGRGRIVVLSLLSGIAVPLVLALLALRH